MQECSLFSTLFPAFIVGRLFDEGRFDQCEVHFSNNERYWASLHVFVSHLYVFFGEMSVYFFSPFFEFVIYCSAIELWEQLLYFWDYLLVSGFVCSYFLPFLRLSFHLAYTFFAVQKLLNLIWPYSFTCAILLYNLVLFIYIHYSGRWVIEYPAVIYVRECFGYVCLLEFYSFWSYV